MRTALAADSRAWRQFEDGLRRKGVAFPSVRAATDPAAVIEAVLPGLTERDPIAASEIETIWAETVVAGDTGDGGLRMLATENTGWDSVQSLITELGSVLIGVGGSVIAFDDAKRSFTAGADCRRALRPGIEASSLLRCGTRYVQCRTALRQLSSTPGVLRSRCEEAFEEAVDAEVQQYVIRVGDTIDAYSANVSRLHHRSALPHTQATPPALGSVVDDLSDLVTASGVEHHVEAVYQLVDACVPPGDSASPSTQYACVRLLDRLWKRLLRLRRAAAAAEHHADAQGAALRVAEHIVAATFEPLLHDVTSWMLEGSLPARRSQPGHGVVNFPIEFFVVEHVPGQFAYDPNAVPELLDDVATIVFKTGAFIAAIGRDTTPGAVAERLRVSHGPAVSAHALISDSSALPRFVAVESARCGELALLRACDGLADFCEELKCVIGPDSSVWEAAFDAVMQAAEIGAGAAERLPAARWTRATAQSDDKCLRLPFFAAAFNRALATAKNAADNDVIHFGIVELDDYGDAEDGEWRTAASRASFASQWPTLPTVLEWPVQVDPDVVTAARMKRLHAIVGGAAVRVVVPPAVGAVIARPCCEVLAEAVTAWMHLAWASYSLKRARAASLQARRLWPNSFGYLKGLERLGFDAHRTLQGLAGAFSLLANDVLTTLSSIVDRARHRGRAAMPNALNQTRSESYATDQPATCFTADDATAAMTTAVTTFAESMGLDCRATELRALCGYCGGHLAATLCYIIGRSLCIELRIDADASDEIHNAVENEGPRRHAACLAAAATGNRGSLAHTFATIRDAFCQSAFDLQADPRIIPSADVQRIASIVDALRTGCYW